MPTQLGRRVKIERVVPAFALYSAVFERDVNFVKFGEKRCRLTRHYIRRDTTRKTSRRVPDTRVRCSASAPMLRRAVVATTRPIRRGTSATNLIKGIYVLS